MKIIIKHFYNSFIITFILFGTACAIDGSSNLKAVIKNSINNAQQTDRTSVRKILQWPDSCEESFKFPTSGLTFFKHTDNNYVVQVICTYGSYQGMSLFYKLNVSLAEASQVKFPSLNSKNKTRLTLPNKAEIWGNVLTTSTVKNFQILNLYNGFGNCGSLATYDLTGNQAKLVTLKSQPDCDAKKMLRDPEKWKTIKLP